MDKTIGSKVRSLMTDLSNITLDEYETATIYENMLVEFADRAREILKLLKGEFGEE